MLSTRLTRALLAIHPRIHALLALAAAVTISALSHVPGNKLPSQGFLTSLVFNFAHAPMFFALGACIALALVVRAEPPKLPASRAALGIGLAFAFALFDEWHQTSVSGRSSDPIDLVTDLAGATAAAFVVRALLEAPPARRGQLRLVTGCAIVALISAAVAAR